MSVKPVSPSPVRRSSARWSAVRSLLALLVVLVAVLVVGPVAEASSTTWRQSIATASGTASTATVTWNSSPLSVRLSVTTGALAAGKCVTAFFDWATPSHYDARAIRDCRSNDTLTYTFTEPTPSTLSGQASKHGICYAVKDGHGTCTGQGSIIMDWTPWPDTTRSAPCDMSWVLRDTNGHQSTFIDAHPRSPTLSSDGIC
jgi:hypothetical protein